MFMSKHIPPLSQNQRKYNTTLKMLVSHDKERSSNIKGFKKELDELTTVWSQEEEKTSLMQKLLSSLFVEVADIEDHQNQIESLVKRNETDISSNLNKLRRESVILRDLTGQIKEEQSKAEIEREEIRSIKEKLTEAAKEKRK